MLVDQRTLQRESDARRLLQNRYRKNLKLVPQKYYRENLMLIDQRTLQREFDARRLLQKRYKKNLTLVPQKYYRENLMLVDQRTLRRVFDACRLLQRALLSVNSILSITASNIEEVSLK